MPKQVRIGVVGLDHWYTAFGVLQEASKVAGARLVAIADKSRRRLDEVGQKHKADYLTTDFAEVIAHPDIDLICSLVNTRDSVGVTRRALRAGKHVACVKPMAMTLRQADALIELAETRNRVLWSFDQLGRARLDRQLRSVLRRGKIGQPLTFYHVMEAGLPKPWHNRTGPSWWTDPKRAPFGAWADHAIYTVDMLRALFDAEVEVVHAEIANRRYPRMGVEDHGVATLRFTNGLVAIIEDSWSADDYWPHWTKIVGTKGVVHMDRVAFEDPVVLATAEGLEAVEQGARRGGLLAEVLRLVRAGQAKPSPARISRQNLAIAFAVYRSAKTGRYVKP
jgi:predicted dehydrogenase